MRKPNVLCMINKTVNEFTLEQCFDNLVKKNRKIKLVMLPMKRTMNCVRTYCSSTFYGMEYQMEKSIERRQEKLHYDDSIVSAKFVYVTLDDGSCSSESHLKYAINLDRPYEAKKQTVLRSLRNRGEFVMRWYTREEYFEERLALLKELAKQFSVAKNLIRGSWTSEFEGLLKVTQIQLKSVEEVTDFLWNHIIYTDRHPSEEEVLRRRNEKRRNLKVNGNNRFYDK